MNNAHDAHNALRTHAETTKRGAFFNAPGKHADKAPRGGVDLVSIIIALIVFAVAAGYAGAILASFPELTFPTTARGYIVAFVGAFPFLALVYAGVSYFLSAFKR